MVIYTSWILAVYAYDQMENGRKVTLDNPKPTRITEFNI